MLSTIIKSGVAVAVLGILTAILTSGSLSALAVPPTPTDIPIVDQTNTLSDTQKSSLADTIAKERNESGNQIAILMINSLEDQALEDYSLSVARGWGIGTGDNNNGVLLLVVKDDRRMRIEVGTGLEGALTDARSGQIISNDIAPRFQEGKYYEGIQAGLTNIIAAINGEYSAQSTVPPSGNSIPWELLFFVAAAGLSWLGSILARTKSWWAGGVVGGAAGGLIGLVLSSLVFGAIAVGILAIVGLVFDKVVSSNYQSHKRRGDTPSWWAGGGFLGGGGGSSGGFGGFGGGGFGGGGASGDW